MDGMNTSAGSMDLTVSLGTDICLCRGSPSSKRRGFLLLQNHRNHFSNRPLFGDEPLKHTMGESFENDIFASSARSPILLATIRRLLLRCPCMFVRPVPHKHGQSSPEPPDNGPTQDGNRTQNGSQYTFAFFGRHSRPNW